jgi:hypothetical protein
MVKRRGSRKAARRSSRRRRSRSSSFDLLSLPGLKLLRKGRKTRGGGKSRRRRSGKSRRRKTRRGGWGGFTAPKLEEQVQLGGWRYRESLLKNAFNLNDKLNVV